MDMDEEATDPLMGKIDVAYRRVEKRRHCYSPRKPRERKRKQKVE